MTGVNLLSPDFSLWMLLAGSHRLELSRSGKPEQRFSLAKSSFLSKLLAEFCSFHNANNACLQAFRLFFKQNKVSIELLVSVAVIWYVPG